MKKVAYTEVVDVPDIDELVLYLLGYHEDMKVFKGINGYIVENTIYEEE